MKKLALVLAAFAIAGCADFKGQLIVSRALEATKVGFFGKVTKITIPVGQYDTTLSGTIGGDLDVSFRVNGKKQSIRLNIPRNSLPEDNGSFSLTPADLKQPFGARGDLRTDVTRGDQQRGVESCTRTRERTVCRRDQDGNRRCHNETETYYGNQEVEFFYRTVTRSIRVELVNPQFPAEAAGAVTGRDTNTSRVYTYQGICY